MIALIQEIALLSIPIKSNITSAAMSPISAMNSRLPSLLQNCGFRTAKNVIVAIINVAARNASVTTSEPNPPYSCTATEITNPLGSTIRLYPTNPATGFVDTADIIHPTITKKQSWMLPDLSVQRKTTNEPKFKSLTLCAIYSMMYIS